MSIVTNKKAYYDYHILEEFECGIVLTGSEVKSIRNGDVTIRDSFIYIKNRELFVKNFRVSRYKRAHQSEVHDELREKKLLVTKREINRIEKLIQERGTTIVPISVFIKRNRLKVKIGVVKGKKLYNKRQAIKERDILRDTKKEIHI
jgi:SsrA-binding protein